MKVQGVMEVWREPAAGYSRPMTSRTPSAAAATCRRAPSSRRSVGRHGDDRGGQQAGVVERVEDDLELNFKRGAWVKCGAVGRRMRHFPIDFNKLRHWHKR